MFRFLDRTNMDLETFERTSDAGEVNLDENVILKLLELPQRKARYMMSPDGSYKVYSVGYGLEVYFGGEPLLAAAGADYLGETDFEAMTIEAEINRAAEFWGLPFAG